MNRTYILLRYLSCLFFRFHRGMMETSPGQHMKQICEIRVQRTLPCVSTPRSQRVLGRLELLTMSVANCVTQANNRVRLAVSPEQYLRSSTTYIHKQTCSLNLLNCSYRRQRKSYAKKRMRNQFIERMRENTIIHPPKSEHAPAVRK